MAINKITDSKLSSDYLSSRFDLYGRWSTCEVDMSEPWEVKIQDCPQDWCSNSFIKINFQDDGLKLYDAKPGEGNFIAKIFEFEKKRPVYTFDLETRREKFPLSFRKINWSNRTAQEIYYNWRDGVRHKYLISSCFPLIRCTVIDSFNLAIQLKPGFLDSISNTFDLNRTYYILWSSVEKDTPLVIACPSGFNNIQLLGDIILFTSPDDRFSVHIGPLFGAALIDTRNVKEPPKNWDERALLLAEGACNMPIDFNEIYHVDEDKNRIKVQRYFKRKRVYYRTSNKKSEDVSIYPPCVFYPETGGKPDSEKSYDIYTLYGKTFITKHKDIVYSFDTPPEISQKLAIPNLNEITGEFAKKVVDLLNERIEIELNEVQEFPKFNDIPFTYAFVALNQQMMACYPLLKEDLKKSLLTWTRKHLEYFFNQKHLP
ncbi:MAG: hypothetical protein M1308_12250, partial [Actinobacteria bacterium]|nr:hypothetical protein [Actinomycetota bacterium]